MAHVCQICKKVLQEVTGQDGTRLEGHYLYDEKVYCVDCWKKANSAPSERKEYSAG